MHELVKNEKKESRARPLQQTRTGPTALSNSMSLSIEEKQQKRIAARAATAMAQVLHRRREPRSLMMWGDRKKAIIKNYPDGGQEIIVPQTLTAEQEHYEFPPRSRFLKKLATSTAERKRLSILQDQIVPCPTVVIDEMKQPDQLALQEWFSKKEDISKLNKDRVVIDWMNDVERSSKNLLSLKQSVKPSPTPSSCYSNKIQFKSDAGKRWANSITSNTSLLPPDDNCRKHYVPRRLLLKPTLVSHEVTMAAASKIQKIWKDYQNNSRSSPAMIESQIGITAMATTGQRTPISGMVHLIQMINNSNKQREQRLYDRAEELESVLHQETKKRQLAEDTMKRLESVYKQQLQQQSVQTNQKEEAYQTLLSKVTELEQSMKRDGQSRKELLDQMLQVTNSNTNLSSASRMSSATREPSIVYPSRKPSVIPAKKPSVVPLTRKPSSVVPLSRKPSIVPSRPSAVPLSRRPAAVPPSKRPTVVPPTRRPTVPPPKSPLPSRKPPPPTIATRKQSILNSTRAFAKPSSSLAGVVPTRKTIRIL